jgi:hypothetical protein
MITFVHKKYLNKAKKVSNFVIYYSLVEIILGLLLFILTMFFSVYYMSVNHVRL